MKKILIFFLLIINTFRLLSQTPSTDSHWLINDIFSDEFNGTRKNIWNDLNTNLDSTIQWGSEFFRPQNIIYGTDNGKIFLRLVAEIVNGTPYTGGIRTGFEDDYLGLGYGYYEIEARVLQKVNIVSGLWPAFWTIHSGKSSQPIPNKWYEEIDIFEPNNCQVRANQLEVGYWYRIDESNQSSPTVKTAGRKLNVDMSLWHKYAVEWIPNRLTFYYDDEPFFILGNGQKTPYHKNTNLYIDLQTEQFSSDCPPNILNGHLGYFDINYFRYYTLNCGNGVITEAQGNGYNFNNYTYNVKKSCIFKNTSIPNGANVFIRATDFIELRENFEVSLGAKLYLDEIGRAHV